MSIFVSKPDSLGDQFIAAGIIQALRELQPATRIVWHVRAGMEVIAPLIGAEVFGPQRMNDPAAEAARLAGHRGNLILLPYALSPFETWTDDLRRRLEWWAAFLRATEWDAAVLALVNRTWVGDFTTGLVPAPRKLGFSANPARQPLVNEAQQLAGAEAPVFTSTLESSFARPEAEQIRDLFALLEPRLKTISPPPAWRLAASIPASAPAARSPSDAAGSPAKRVLLAPGVGAEPRRAWGIPNLLAVATALQTQGASVRWLEGPDDVVHCRDLPAGEGSATLRLGRQDLMQLVGELKQTDLFVCHDTAYAHLAAGLGVPTVAIYGAGQNRRFHPIAGQVKVVTSEIACAGCQWHCLWDRLYCVSGMPVDAVTGACFALLAGDASPVTVPIPTPLAHAAEGEAAALRRRLQEEIVTLNADRFARLQIIQSLLSPRAPTPPPAGGEPRVSVIIPMGRPERVAPTLASLAAQQVKSAHWQIVLVGVEAESVARAHPHLPIVPVRLARNELPPRTRCLGVERASGDWYLFLDDDVELATDCFARMAELFATAPFAADGDRPVGSVGFRLPGKSGRFFERLTDMSNFWAQQTGPAEDRDWLYSAAILVRAQAYHASGGFNPELPNGEDVDLTRRIAAAGYRLRYEPSLVARHDHRRDTLTAMWRYFWRNGNAARYFFSAHGGACPFSLKTVWLKAWSDLQMNLEFQRQRQTRVGWLAPLIWLNYVIVEASLEWHWQEYLHEEGRYRHFPARARSDHTFVAALAAWDKGRSVRGAMRYALAVLQDFSNPVRR